jgi:hypothetical protein
LLAEQQPRPDLIYLLGNSSGDFMVAKEAPQTIVGLFVCIIQLGYCFQCSSNFGQLLAFASIAGSFHVNRIVV